MALLFLGFLSAGALDSYMTNKMAETKYADHMKCRSAAIQKAKGSILEVGMVIDQLCGKLPNRD